MRPIQWCRKQAKVKKSLTYRMGLILVGLSGWASFDCLWMHISMYWRWLDYRVGIITNLMVGAMIFTFIGFLMMQEPE